MNGGGGGNEVKLLYFGPSRRKKNKCTREKKGARAQSRPRKLGATHLVVDVLLSPLLSAFAEEASPELHHVVSPKEPQRVLYSLPGAKEKF